MPGTWDQPLTGPFVARHPGPYRNLPSFPRSPSPDQQHLGMGVHSDPFPLDADQGYKSPLVTTVSKTRDDRPELKWCSLGSR